MRVTAEYIKTQPFDIVGNGREVRMNCPNCSDTTKHLYVNQDRNVYYCFKCGEGGTIQVHTEPSLEQFDLFVKKDVRSLTPGSVVTVKATTDKKLIKSLPPNTVVDSTTALSYLRSRGITDREINTYDIRESTDKHGIYKYSIIFPITRTIKVPGFGALNYFVCRKYDRSEPKYVNAPWAKNDTMFITENFKGRPTVIVEGIFDALAISRVGFNAIALLGKKATAQQLNRLRVLGPYKIYLDRDALTHAIQLKLQLNALSISASLIQHDKDAADLYMVDRGISLTATVNRI